MSNVTLVTFERRPVRAHRPPTHSLTHDYFPKVYGYTGQGQSQSMTETEWSSDRTPYYQILTTFIIKPLTARSVPEGRVKCSCPGCTLVTGPVPDLHSSVVTRKREVSPTVKKTGKPPSVQYLIFPETGKRSEKTGQGGVPRGESPLRRPVTTTFSLGTRDPLRFLWMSLVPRVRNGSMESSFSTLFRRTPGYFESSLSTRNCPCPVSSLLESRSSFGVPIPSSMSNVTQVTLSLGPQDHGVLVCDCMFIRAHLRPRWSIQHPSVYCV